MRIVGVDPGGSTGLATVEDNNIITCTLELEDHHLQLWNYLSIKQPDLIVCERFDYRKRSNQKQNLNLMAREYIGVVKLYGKKTRTPYHMQMQLDNQSGLWHDKKLKELGHYKEARSHEMDALRHVLYYITQVQKDFSWLEKWKAAARS